METNNSNTNTLLSEIERLKSQLFEANSVIDAIKQGDVDALVLNKDGKAHIYSIESADYTYRILIEKFGEGALSISDKGLILYCNDYFSQLMEMPAEKIVGTYFNSYMDSPAAFENIKKTLKYGPSKEEIVLNANGTKRHVYISMTDLQPHVDAIGVVVTDLTEKRKHEEALVRYQQKLELKVDELNQANTSLEQFIHVISHDLKEPLRKILMYSSHLSESKADIFSEKEMKNLNIINSSATRLNSLVDDLVTYAFSASNPDIGTVDLDKIIREVLDDLEIVIKENEAVVTFSKLPVITGSKVQMRQLFSNLISNAIKYSKKGIAPRINISIGIVNNIDLFAPEKQFYQIAVHDNGIGMEESHLGKIFTIFQRLHMRSEYSGNGIGLAICKKIMENHEGRIQVESTIGKGSIFHLYLPLING